MGYAQDDLRGEGTAEREGKTRQKDEKRANSEAEGLSLERRDRRETAGS